MNIIGPAGYIPKNTAIAIVIGQAVVGQVLLHVQSKAYKKVIDDQQERLKIFHESLDFLLERADGATLVELDKNLDFWRVVRGYAPPQG